jgi:hypothetical protein
MPQTKKVKSPGKFHEIKDRLVQANENVLFADGFEEALIGGVEIFHRTIALYDKDKCLDILMKRDGMTWEEASEFFEFNTQGAYVGENTPAFATIDKR